MGNQITALIVAAGRGSRAGGERPKQYQCLAGRPVLSWALNAFLTHPKIDAVRAVINPEDSELYNEAVNAIARPDQAKLLSPAEGGSERQDSVRQGLESLVAHAPHWVLIHDAARPFITPDVIDRVVEAVGAHGAAIAALPIADTLKRAGDPDDRIIGETVARDGLWRAQTPQGFEFSTILKAHRRASGRSLTDDAAVAEAAGHRVALALGSPNNTKITVAEDFGLAEQLAQRLGPAQVDLRSGQWEYRTGQGFDVHRFGEGDHVTICGVPVPHTSGLLGHSDADVGMHAITDAIFGALGEGDIGDHFPPSDPQWRGTESRIFLEKANDLAHARGGRVTHVDVTLICEAPKIGPHRDVMRERIGEVLQLSKDRVSVKATTTEMLGFTGRAEGVAALATATVALPI